MVDREWYDAIGKFKDSFHGFLNVYQSLQNDESKVRDNPELYHEWQKLTSRARFIKEKGEYALEKINTLLAFANTDTGSNTVGALPLAIPVVLALAAGAIALITKFTTDYLQFSSKISLYNKIRNETGDSEKAAAIVEKMTEKDGSISQSLQTSERILKGMLPIGAIILAYVYRDNIKRAMNYVTR